tara:strand:- start:766 stop:1026 length:261 start_codon:yes stop_codon:yes gene_type:complete
MLKNPKKADLDKDGKLSGYEMKRGKAIEENMKKTLGGDIKKIKAKKMMKAMGGMEVKGYGQARSKGMGLQDESVPMKDMSYIKDLI